MIDRLRTAVQRLDDLFGAWVHPDARADVLVQARHASLIASHLAGGLVASLVFAGYFAWSGAPGAAALVALACFLSPIAIAVFVSRTGRLEVAQLMSAVQLTMLVVLAATLSGGTASFALVWLALVPLEAALSAERRMTVLATVLALAALVGLHIATGQGLLPPPTALPFGPTTTTFASCLGAAAYAGALAANVQKLHRSAALALETSRAQYRLIAENANDLITRHEADGSISFASLASIPLLGLSAQALTARGLAPCLAADDRSRFADAMQQCLATGEPMAQEFLVERDAGGGVAAASVWLEMRCQRVEVADAPGPYAVIAVTRDITRAKAEAAEVARARAEAERASKAKTAFLATMSHELRTPLSSIIGFAELLHRELLIKSREPKQADYCRIIHQSGEHLLSLVKDLLDVSRIESGRMVVTPEPFDIAEMAAVALETLRPQAQGKEITLSGDFAPGLPDVLADRRATKQILINLVSNACKFTPAGGRVTLSARSVEGVMQIRVADTGIGIAPEHVERIAQPFYQIETTYARNNDGVGLGLSIVRGLVDLHQGTLTIESEPGAGSTFIVTLPIDVAPAVEERSSQAAPAIVDLAEIHAQRTRAAALVELAAAHAQSSDSATGRRASGGA